MMGFGFFTLRDCALSAQRRAVLGLRIENATTNYNLFTNVNSSPLYKPGITDITLTIDAAVGGPSSGNSLSVPNQFNPRDTITIINNSTVSTGGGSGGVGGFASPGQPGGSVPGAALFVARPVTIINNGTFAGGGGGGGGGGSGRSSPFVPFSSGGPGGGGAGNPAGGAGASPTTGAPGSGGGPFSGSGGPGGSLGFDGNPGTPGSAFGGGPGGTRGFYLNGNPFVTWSVTGTRSGRLV